MALKGHTIEFELFPRRTLHVVLFRGVRNAAALAASVAAREDVVAGLSLLNFRMLCGPLHLLAAANKALIAQSSRMVTRSLQQELVYALSASRNVSETSRIFGVSAEEQDGDDNGGGRAGTDLVLACRFDAPDAAAAEREMEAVVEGTVVSLGGGRGADGSGLALLAAPQALLAEVRAEAAAGTGPRLAMDGELEFGCDMHLRKVFKLQGEKEVGDLSTAVGREQLQHAVVLRLATKES